MIKVVTVKVLARQKVAVYTDTVQLLPNEAGQPESDRGFGFLKQTQAFDDVQALLDAGRRVIRFDLGTAVTNSVRQLTGKRP